jgi:tripartite-type tricarboxylate transporter receptor subunit TctC
MVKYTLAERKPMRTWLFAVLLVPMACLAQAFPSRPVQVIVPFPAGSAPDIVARTLTERLSATWGQGVVVENRPGAGGIPGMTALIKSPPTGYTLAIVPATVLTLTPVLFKEARFDPDRDIVPVAPVATTPLVLAVRPESGIRSLGELVAMAKKSPDKVEVSVLANGATHYGLQYFNSVAGIRLFPVPYNGSPAALAAVLGGHHPATFEGLAPLLGSVRAGKLTLLAVSSASRLPGYENVPTIAESYPGFSVGGWLAVFAPAGTPSSVVDRVNADVNAVLKDPQIVTRLAEVIFYPFSGAPAEVADFVKRERVLWTKIARDAGIQPQ